MLGDNAIRCYELDESALQEVAARISAPTAAELSEPPDTLPDITASMAFRTVGPWDEQGSVWLPAPLPVTHLVDN